MRKITLAFLAVLTLVGCGYSPGLNSTADHFKSAQAADNVDAQVVRVEFSASATATSLDASVDALADRGIQALLLAGACGNLPTAAQASNMGSWAVRFGPGGAFWASRSDGHLAVTNIEWCNETSYRNGAPDGPGAGDDWWASPQYLARADNYARRAAEAIFNINQANASVKLLVQGDSGGSGSPNWMNAMFDAVPNLDEIAGGFVVHPYGPRTRWEPKIDWLVADLAANGAPASTPIDITEYGLSSDNGAVVSPDNYGWPTNQTYAQAAAALDLAIGEIRTKYEDRIQHFIIYSAYDLRNPGVKECGGLACREQFFGAVRFDLSDKGVYSTEVRQQFGAALMER
jgi:hypothetical protein